MTPEQAQQAREQALRNAILGLGRLSSDELHPNHDRAAGVLWELRERIGQIEREEGGAGQRRHAESEAAAAFQRDEAGRFRPGAAPRNRGESPLATMTEDERIAAVMEQMARSGLGRI